MSLSISVQFASAAAHLPSRAQVRRWALAAHADNAGAGDGVVTIRYVDEKEGRALNHDFRGKDYATNVLTFVQDGSPLVGNASTVYAADIAICAPVIAREAREQKKAVHDHHAHMVVHGMLHAQGLDHEDAVEAAAMEAIEIAVLQRFRIQNPYELA
jgi:probable rRNA maturation factor